MISDSAALTFMSFTKIYTRENSLLASSYNISIVSSTANKSDLQVSATFTSQQYVNESSKISTNSRMTSAMANIPSVSMSPSLIDSITMHDHMSFTASMTTIRNINTNTVSQSDHQMISTVHVVMTPTSNSQ